MTSLWLRLGQVWWISGEDNVFYRKILPGFSRATTGLMLVNRPPATELRLTLPVSLPHDTFSLE